MNYKLPSTFRLKTARQFKQVFHKARRLSSQKFALLVNSNNLTYPRLAIMISKRYVRNAVTRNKLRRIIRESFRLHKNIIQGYDIVFIAYKGLDSITNEELTQCLEKQWRQLSVCQEKL